MELYDSIVDRLNSQHLSVTELINIFNEADLHRAPAPGKWSIHNNLAHITGYHHILLERLNKILESKNPYFKRYSTDDDPDYEKWNKFNTGDLLKHLNENRETMTSFLLNLTSEQLSRKGTHQIFGTMNIVEWIEFFLLHEAHHIYTIFKLTRQLKA